MQERGRIYKRGGQVGELGLGEPLRWHMPADERGDSQGERREREREREQGSKEKARKEKK